MSLLRLRLTESRADSWKLAPPTHTFRLAFHSTYPRERGLTRTVCEWTKDPSLSGPLSSYRLIRHLELLLSSLKDSRSLGENAQEHNLTSTVSTGRAISWSHALDCS